MSQLPYCGRYTNEFIQTMIGQLPGFELALGSDLFGVAAFVRNFVQRADKKMVAFAQPAHSEKVQSRPLITVIIPVHNGAKFLSEAIDSVLAQDYGAVEIIVVDDGSEDDIESVVDALPVDVRFFRQNQCGPGAARNRGIKDASGDFVAFLDVDDLWPSNNLTVLVEAFDKNPELGVVHGYGQLMQYNEQSKSFDYVGNPEESFPCYLGAGLYRRGVFERVGLFDPDLYFGEDTDWYSRAEEHRVGILRLPEVTLLVRRHGANMTANRTTTREDFALFKKKLDRIRGQGQQ
jgi:glycosyltransferase involved in cell wall biosynthesis